MQKVAVVLVCVACAGHGRRVETTSPHPQKHRAAETQKALASLLVSATPAAAFNPALLRAPFPKGSAALGSSRLLVDGQDRLGRCVALATPMLLAEDVAQGADGLAGLVATIEAFQQSHSFLIGILVTIATNLIIGEARRRVEKPVMDEVGRRVAAQVTPDTNQIGGSDWAKLGACVALDLAGDASELIPFLGEFTDIAYAPVEAALLKAFFKSDLIAGFGFLEELLPFTDIIPTFTLSWCLATLWPTTPVAKALLPQEDKALPQEDQPAATLPEVDKAAQKLPEVNINKKSEMPPKDAK